jgi:ParB family protein of integrating conjugative element (PFGI_1 class)
MRTPETLTAAQRAARLRDQAPDGDSAPTSSPHEPHPVTPKPTSLDKARASLMSPLSQRPSASANLDPRAEIEGSISLLSIDDIEFYDHNPRVGDNPKYAEIRDSVIADGITNILTVTRRPGGLKYFPYGGGNTRLKVAKELHAQGDPRFAQLRVVIKAWKTEFDVIAAHLVENENRGDTSFWEKALGVATFKREYEREFAEHSLIGTELNRELGKRGMNFGVKMIQNFLFSVEYLSPVGPWLRTHDVNTVLRPKLAEFLDLTGRFDKIEEAGDLVRSYLERTANGLRSLIERNGLRDPSEHVAVELDAQRVVQDMAQALADLLGLERERFVLLSAALASDPRLQAKDLQALKAQRTEAPTAARSPASGAFPGTYQVSQPDTGSRHSTMGGDSPPSSPPAQRSLGPMAGVVGGTASGMPGTSEASTGSPPHAVHGEPSDAFQDGADGTDGEFTSTDVRRKRLRGQMVSTITQINSFVPIHDFMKGIDAMPFGFFVDLPDSLAEIDGQDVSVHAEDRGMLWQFLASVSGQLHELHWQQVADEPYMQGTRWAEVRSQGAAHFVHTVAHAVYGNCQMADPTRGIFELYLPSGALWTLLSDSRLAQLLGRVIEIRRLLQQLEPEMHHERGMQLRFSPTDSGSRP